MRFMSGEKEGYFSRCRLFCSNQFVTKGAVCFGSLSCWKYQFLAMFSFFADCQKFFCHISRYRSPLMFPSINTKLPTRDDEKHRQHLTFPLPCFPVVSVHLGLSSSLADRQTMTFPSDPNKFHLSK